MRLFLLAATAVTPPPPPISALRWHHLCHIFAHTHKAAISLRSSCCARMLPWFSYDHIDRDDGCSRSSKRHLLKNPVFLDISLNNDLEFICKEKKLRLKNNRHFTNKRASRRHLPTCTGPRTSTSTSTSTRPTDDVDDTRRQPPPPEDKEEEEEEDKDKEDGAAHGHRRRA